MLALTFAVIAGSWYEGPAAFALPFAVVLLGLGAVALAFARLPRAVDAPLHNGWSNALCQGISNPSLTLDHGVVEFVNQAFLAMLGYRDRSDEVVGLPFANLVHPADQQLLLRWVAQPPRGTADESGGWLRLVASDGSVLKAQLSVSQPQGMPVKRLLQLVPHGPRDDPAQRFEGLADIVDQVDVVLFKTDAEGRLEYVNRGWERLTGRTAARSRGVPLISMLHPEDHAGVAEPLRAIGSGRLDQLSAQARLVMAGGSVAWVLLRARACTRPDGDLIGTAGTLTEISPRKTHDANLGSTRRTLNTLLANVPGMVYRCLNDRDWTMEFVSDGCMDLTGYEPFELVANSRVSFGSLIHAQDRAFVWAQVQRQLVLHQPYQVSYRIVDAQQRTRWVWEQARGVYSAQGELLAIEGFITDISERQGAAEQARRRMWFEARTGMLARPLFDNLLAHVWQHAQLVGYPYAVFVIDLGGAGDRAERLGADRAEQALDQLARRCSQIGPPGSAVSFLEPHQFAMLVTDFRRGGTLRSAPETRELIPAASRMAQQMAEALSKPLGANGEITHTVAVGIALSDARYLGAAAMLQAARHAAVQAAEHGPGRCEFADE